MKINTFKLLCTILFFVCISFADEKIAIEGNEDSVNNIHSEEDSHVPEIEGNKNYEHSVRNPNHDGVNSASVDQSKNDKHVDQIGSNKETEKNSLDEGGTEKKPHQSGPFIDLLGDNLYSLQMVDDTHAQLNTIYTNDALAGKNVVGLYFSADWCGPCRQFTPELVSFYKKMNARRGRENKFEIVWISRCRDVKSWGQYFTHMNWLALPPEEAMGARGQMLATKFKMKTIPHLVLLDDLGNVITLQGREKIPQDKAGIGFPWRNPLLTLYIRIIPRSLRFLLKSHSDKLKGRVQKTFSELFDRSAIVS